MSKPKGHSESRHKVLHIPFPEVPEYGSYLVETVSDLGWSSSNGFGETALPWAEILAYAEATGSLVETWEFRCVRKMSMAYATEINNNSLLCIAPYDRK